MRTEAGFSVRCSVSRGGMTHGPQNIQRFVEVLLSTNRRGLAWTSIEHVVVGLTTVVCTIKRPRKGSCGTRYGIYMKTVQNKSSGKTALILATYIQAGPPSSFTINHLHSHKATLRTCIHVAEGSLQEAQISGQPGLEIIPSKQIVKRICNIQSMQGTNMLCYAHYQTRAAVRLPK